MSRTRALAYVALTACLVGGCKDQPTGVHVIVHLGAIAYDELRFGVLELADDGSPPVTLIDPESAGRKTNLAGAAPAPDIMILLPDAVDGKEVLCDVEALLAGAPVGNGDTPVQAQAHRIRDVDVYMTAAPPADGGVSGDASGSGGGGGNGGGAGGDNGGEGGSGAGGQTGSGGGGGGNGSGGAGGRNGSGGAGGNGNGGAGGGNGSGGNRGAGGAVDAGRPETRTDGGAGGANGSGGASGTGGKPGTGALGTMCTSAGQCASLFCVDGVCCESACKTACTTCNLNAGQAGRCRQVMNRAVDPRHICVDTGAGNCGTDGTCDATGACTIKFGAACTAGCATTRARFAAGLCNQGGTCVGVGTVLCPAGMPACVAGVCR